MQTPLWIVLPLSALLGCAGRLDNTVRERAAADFACDASSIELQETREGGFNTRYYRATGCDRSGEYVAECNLIACVSRSAAEQAELEARQQAALAEQEAAAAERRAAAAEREAASAPASSSTAPSGPVFVSMQLTNLCPQKVLLFRGRNPESSGGRHDSIGGNSIINVSGNEGDSIWIVDERRNGMSSFTYNRNVKNLFITKSCTGFSTSR